ncbi:MAG: hypothetical protein IJO60_04160 [Agathobacter sp.]|nr:hypothetical protein [Agathobacter sp.]
MGGSTTSRLVIPSCQGILDCFNNKLSRYYRNESFCCLQGEPDNLMLLALFSFIYLNPESAVAPATWKFQLSFFKKYIGYTGGGKSYDLPTRMRKASEVKCMWNYENIENVMNISFSADAKTVTIESMYFALLIKHMAQFKGEKNKWGKKVSSGKSMYSSMVFASILKERNIPAVEITIELVKLIERRGPLMITENAHISIQALIERCPNLYRQVQGAAEVKEKNRIVKNAVLKSMELLKTQTDIFEHFESLTVTLPEKFSIAKENTIIIEYFRRLC